MSRSVLITGGSSGIGLSLAKLMSEQGGDVATIARDYSKVPGGSSFVQHELCLLYTSPSPRDLSTSRMPSSA